ncbi:MAG: hypothetical protein R3C99_21505 [Pirellulaceae bacterium]|nr:hypothetical protein [Planctomycetales bacterium]MCA9165720.1 hypothetical protein [Planctomycetales bacterium]MCA9202638.1 hypothetical protein [Planctomycetales bacterium]MCA9209669.1 hypothetical protein [Planctomycetales bacterium]MCA9220123.1 hypothetical protein [Planctomycetales bacterium]
MIEQIRDELNRLDAGAVQVRLDREFEPKAGELVRIDIDDAYWHMLPADFHTLLQDLPNGAGEEQVHRAIESFDSQQVWHGHSPDGSRDSTA